MSSSGSNSHSSFNLDTNQLASRLHKSRWWIYTNRHKLNIPTIKVGRELLFPLAAIEAWEQEHLI